MPPLDYLVLRVIRRHLPDRTIRALLGRGLIIRPGLETRSPHAATRRFLDALKSAGETIAGRRVMIFGYGGRFEVGVEAGRRVGRQSLSHDLGLESRARPQWLTVINAPLDGYISGGGEPVDLRDHFFKHPFEMLGYSERQWRGFLNPGSNLNRLRAWDYERLFSQSFSRVTVEILYDLHSCAMKRRSLMRDSSLQANIPVVPHMKRSPAKLLAWAPRRCERINCISGWIG